MNEAAPEDVCFAEDCSVPLRRWFDRIILYKWNRSYPADLILTSLLQRMGGNWFPLRICGNSHEKITRGGLHEMSKDRLLQVLKTLVAGSSWYYACCWPWAPVPVWVAASGHYCRSRTAHQADSWHMGQAAWRSEHTCNS